MPALHRVDVVADAASRGRFVYLRRDGDSMRHAARRRIDDAGRCVFENIPAATYELAGAAGSMSVVVDGDLEVTLALRPERAFRVTVDDVGGPLARAGFRTDDFVIGAGGTEFTDRRQMQATMRRALKDSNQSMIELTILRDARD